MKIKYLFWFLIFLSSDSVMAQCPYGIPNTPGCVPPDAWPQNSGTQTASQRQQRWVYTWGAIAMDPKIFGVSTGLDTKRQAEKAALKDCRAGGGGECKVLISYHHQCVAFANSGPWSSASRGPDLDQVKLDALRDCEKQSESDGKQCKIIYSNCTEPYVR